MKLTTKELMEMIPHRHPFLLVDTTRRTGTRCAGCGTQMCDL